MKEVFGINFHKHFQIYEMYHAFPYICFAVIMAFSFNMLLKISIKILENTENQIKNIFRTITTKIILLGSL